MLHKKTFCLVVASFLLAACNGGGGGGGDSKDDGGSITNSGPQHLPAGVGSISGVFLDSEVIGLNYTTGSTSGVTDASGGYTCNAGDTITFKLGAHVIGSAPCLPVITPIEIISNGALKADEATFNSHSVVQFSDAQNIKLRKLSMFLQTLDSDGLLATGITPHANAETVVNGLLDGDSLADVLSDSDMDDFEDALDAYVATLGGSHAAATVASSMSHIVNTISTLNACTTSDVARSASVAGYAPNCVALTCQSGSTLSNGACTENFVYSFAKVIEYLDTKYQRPFISGKYVFNNEERFFIGPQASNMACKNVNSAPHLEFFEFTSYIEADAVLEDVLNFVKIREIGPYSTQANEVWVIAGKKCAEQVADRVLQGLITDQRLLAGLLNQIGATESQAFASGGINEYDLQILDLLIDHYDI